MGQTTRVTTILWLLLLSTLPGQAPDRPQEESALESAEAAARWLKATAIETDRGLRWAPPGARSIVDHLYSGTAGVVLFLVELHAVGGGDEWLALARRAGDDLVARRDAIGKGPAGLYTGSAGVGLALEALHGATKDGRYGEAAAAIRAAVVAGAKPSARGVRFGPVTDIIAGTAGTGLWLARDGKTLPVAIRAGRGLVASGRRTEHGLSWRMSPGYARLMPNFSHGTAGIAYFLADLYGRTRDEAFLEAAVAGARHLLAIADDSKPGFRVHHHSPGGEDLYYLGWCHGPAGTARLFWRLWQVTGDEEWKKHAIACGDAILATGIPEKRTPGFWETVGQCCGTAGVADFLLALGQGTKEPRFAAACVRFDRDLHRRATRKDGRLYWIQAEHRVRPELLHAQPGWAQGAAGIGMWFVRRHAAATGRKLVVRMPDDPWERR